MSVGNNSEVNEKRVDVNSDDRAQATGLEMTGVGTTDSNAASAVPKEVKATHVDIVISDFNNETLSEAPKGATI